MEAHTTETSPALLPSHPASPALVTGGDLAEAATDCVPWALAAAHTLAALPTWPGDWQHALRSAASSGRKAPEMESRADPSLGQGLSWEVARVAGEGQPDRPPGPLPASVKATDSEMLCSSFLPSPHALLCPPCKPRGCQLRHPGGMKCPVGQPAPMANLGTIEVSSLEPRPDPPSASGRHRSKVTKKVAEHFRLCPLWLSKGEIKGKRRALFRGGAARKVSGGKPSRTGRFNRLPAHL